ncbi:COP9 signalosome complex subunit 1 isoform X2 [Sesamum indicum]|uniref:COP9 signalosome complex subunit 1 isoform X2 n=1 Tax=Sesamum indicum TaxID=4182 RepID=A0A6I9TZX9_SESIN|nr:COP9 signalosome complex subunit 1 isoform X2 [Sesamum indicum]
MAAEGDAVGPVIEEDDISVDVGEKGRHRPVMVVEHLDIEAYAALYTGRTKISRLLFIAENCGVASMELEALRMAYDEIRKGEDTQLFREVVAKIDGRLGPDYGSDNAWADDVDRRAELRKEKLENELNASMTNLIKESIRMGYNDFGDFYYAHGQLEEAFKSYIRTHEYCTTSAHIVHMCLNAILVSIEMGHFFNISSYFCMAWQNQDRFRPDSVTISKLHCAAGLAAMMGEKYKFAAREFVDTGMLIQNSYTEVIALQDVATYGGLCALATFNRAELKRYVIDNINFRNCLELVPEIRELINDFYSGRYVSCMEYLENPKANLLLDIHLHDHLKTLYERIRNKALTHYVLPFVSVDLHMMANAFKTSVTDLEKELEALIPNNQIKIRGTAHSSVSCRLRVNLIGK